MPETETATSPEITPFVPPDTAEALARLNMPMADAMRTQRAVRRLHTEPVEWEVLREVLALALKAPTSSNSQDWTFVVVTDAEQKKKLVRSYQQAFNLVSKFEKLALRRVSESDRRQWNAASWQGRHFHELPVLVVPCYRHTIKHRPTGWPHLTVTSYYGSVYPAVQNILLASRAVGLGASLQTLPLWNLRHVRKVLELPRSVVPACVIPIGWARGKYGPTTRPPIEEVLHMDRYGNQPFRTT